MSIIAFENTSFSYDGTRVLQNINFTVQQGDYLCIVGPNGAGKTTLLKGLLGLKKPSTGNVVFGDGLKAKEIGYLPQQTQIQKDFPASVLEVIYSGCLNKLGYLPFYTRKHKQLVQKAVETLHIENLIHSSYQELSGGQQQRVRLARALCASSKVLVLDEPVNGLDPQISQDLYKTIEEIHAQGMAIVMISHDVHNAVKYANKILHIGKQVFFGITEEYVQSSIGMRFLGEEE